MFNDQRMTNSKAPMLELSRRAWAFVIEHLNILWSLRHWPLVISFSLLAPSLRSAVPGDPTLQTDANWIDDRWQKTDVGPFLCAAIETPRQKICKGIAIKVGDNAEGTVCFD